MRDYVAVNVRGPVAMCRPLALLLTQYAISRASRSISIHIINIVRHDVPPYVPTTLLLSTQRRSNVREYVPVQVSWPAPEPRHVARPSLTTHMIHVVRHNVLLYVSTTLCRCTQRQSTVRDVVPVQASLTAPTPRPSARPLLTIHIINVRGT